MPQKYVSTVKFEVPITAEGLEGQQSALDQTKQIHAGIEKAGGKIVSHSTAVRQIKSPKGTKA